MLLLILTLLAVGAALLWLAWGDTVDIMLQAGDISTVGPALVKIWKDAGSIMCLWRRCRST